MPPKESVAILSSSKVKKSHKRRGKRFWLKIINEFEGNPLSLHAFCFERGLAVSTFYGWCRRLNLTKLPPEEPQRKTVKLLPKFLPIYVKSPETVSQDLKTPKETKEAVPSQILTEEKVIKSSDLCLATSSGLSLQLNNGLKITIDKDFHGPTLQRLVHIFSSEIFSPC